MAASRPSVIAEREAFIAGQGDLDASRLVFLDESGVDVAMSRSYGWAPAGETPMIERPARGRRVNFIGALALDGVRALSVVEGYVNGEGFIRYLREDLGPKLKAGDLVVMDGPRLHRVAGVAEALAEYGAAPLYLPPYSPELNPIEMAWAWIKALLRARPQRKLAALRESIQSLWLHITTTLCQGWIKHSGYAST